MKKLSKSALYASLALVLVASIILIGKTNSSKSEAVDAATIEAAVEAAQEYMTDELYTIVDKVATPPNNDSKNNYMSMGPYWWPNEATDDGLPYVRRDGEVNPERNDYTDHMILKKTTSAITSLGQAYHYTQDEKYAERARDIVNAFFIDPATQMLPNLQYGQFVPGLHDGRCYGIIESVALVEMLSGLEWIAQSPAWTPAIDEAFDSWIAEFYNWLMTSDLGIKERKTYNNHGTHYDRQCVGILIYLGRTEEAAAHLEAYTKSRLEGQIAPDGSQPEELSRTKSWNYCLMNLKGWVVTADYADEVGVDLWHHSKDGQIYLKSMIDWYIPYLQMEAEWEWAQIGHGNLNGIKELFERAAEVYNDDSYLTIVENLQPLKGGLIK